MCKKLVQAPIIASLRPFRPSFRPVCSLPLLVSEPEDTPSTKGTEPTSGDPSESQAAGRWVPPFHSATLAGIALVVGVAQLLAATTLELASPRELGAAQARGPVALYWLLGSVALGSASVYAIRRNPPRALLSGVLWSLATAYGVYRGGHARDLAFYGEPVAYHLLAILSTLLIWNTTWKWLRDASLGGKRRALPAILACSGSAILLLEHLGASVEALAPLRTLGVFSGIARMFILLSWPVALWVAWNQLRGISARFVPLFGSALLTLRVAAAGPEGLLGATVEGAGVIVVCLSFIVVAMATAVAMRPRLGLYVHIVLGAVSMGACLLFLSVYYSGYGSIEDGLSGILRSLFGFDVPLPFHDQPGWWRPAVVMVGIFFLFYSAYASIVSAADRTKGVALSLMLLAGLNLLSPYLVLMLGAGGLYFVDVLLVESRQRSTAERAEANADLLVLLEALSERLGFEAPVRIAGRRGEVLKLFGKLRNRPAELLIRTQPGKAPQAELMAGVLGRGDPLLSLLPDGSKRGERPSHLIARSHRLKGEVRVLEAMGEQPLDAMMPFVDGEMHVWDGGVFCQLGSLVSEASVDEVEALVRACARTAERVG